MSKGYIRITQRATVGGAAYEAGAVIEADAELTRELLRQGLAVPAAVPGKRTLTVDAVGVDIKPVVRRAQ